MVNSRNQMILDLTTHFSEKPLYRDSSQSEAWGLPIYLSLEDSIILPDNIQESSWRTFFLRGKRKADTEPDILDREALP